MPLWCAEAEYPTMDGIVGHWQCCATRPAKGMVLGDIKALRRNSQTIPPLLMPPNVEEGSILALAEGGSAGLPKGSARHGLMAAVDAARARLTRPHAAHRPRDEAQGAPRLDVVVKGQEGGGRGRPRDGHDAAHRGSQGRPLRLHRAAHRQGCVGQQDEQERLDAAHGGGEVRRAEQLVESAVRSV